MHMKVFHEPPSREVVYKRDYQAVNTIENTKCLHSPSNPALVYTKVTVHLPSKELS